jgi:hypothetical protein
MSYNKQMLSSPIKKSLLIGLFFFCIYSLSAAATPTGIADADELTLTSYFLSVPHPPGFPLFTLLGFLGIHTIGLFTNPAHAANLISAIYQATAVSLFFFLSLQLIKLFSQKKHTLLPLIATMLFGFSYLIWNYATIYEITSFTALLAMATLVSAISWYQAKKPQQKYLFFATWIVAGILLAHYHLAILYFPAFLWLVFAAKKFDPKSFSLGLLTLATTAVLFSSILFLLNTNTPFSWDFSKTGSGWWNHLMRRDYEGLDLETNTLYQSAFAVPNLFDEISFQSILDYLSTVINHFTLPVGITMILGSIYLWQKNRIFFWFNLLLFLFSGPLLAAYMKTASYSFQINRLLGIAERQYILGEFAAALFILPGLLFIKQIFAQKTALVPLTLTILTVYQLYSNSSIIFSPQTRSFNYDFQKQKLLQADADALIICSTDIDCYTLWYLSRVEQVRPDIVVLSHVPTYSTHYLTSQFKTYPFSQNDNPEYLKLLIAHNYPNRPIYFSSGIGFYDEYLGLENGPFFLLPTNNMFRLTTQYPETLSFNAAPNVPSPIDPRARYPRGIIEAIANNAAYAGYLSLKYGQPDIGSQYLQASIQLDPASLQTQELINFQQAIAESVFISDPQFTPQKLITLGLQAETAAKWDEASQYFRYAYLLGGNNPKIINAALDFYNRTNDIDTVNALNELLVYNNQMPE